MCHLAACVTVSRSVPVSRLQVFKIEPWDVDDFVSEPGYRITVSEAARRFDGTQLTFPRSPSDPQPLEQAPQQVLISLRLPDGRKTVMTADRSIHQSAK